MVGQREGDEEPRRGDLAGDLASSLTLRRPKEVQHRAQGQCSRGKTAQGGNKSSALDIERQKG